MIHLIRELHRSTPTYFSLRGGVPCRTRRVRPPVGPPGRLVAAMIFTVVWEVKPGRSQLRSACGVARHEREKGGRGGGGKRTDRGPDPTRSVFLDPNELDSPSSVPGTWSLFRSLNLSNGSSKQWCLRCSLPPQAPTPLQEAVELVQELQHGTLHLAHTCDGRGCKTNPTPQGGRAGRMPKHRSFLRRNRSKHPSHGLNL